MDELAAVRRAFAKHVTFMANVTSPALEAAFAEVRREDYVGPGPWPIFVWTGYRKTTSAGFATAPRGMQGAYFCIQRRGTEFHARFVSGTAIIPGEGMRDAASEAALAAGFADGRVQEVTRLYRETRPAEDAWAQAEGWALCYR